MKIGFVRHSSVFIFLFVFLLASKASGQIEPAVNPPAGDLSIKNDTINNISADTLKTDTLGNQSPDSLQNQPQGDIETTINYTARDSIRTNVDGKMIWLFGDAKIIYGTIEVQAEEIVIDYASNTITAQGVKDSLGNRIGYPIFKNGTELYETKGIVYNFKTKRAKIKEVVTQQGESFIHSETAFKNEHNEIFSTRNSFTTCNLEHPHYEIISTKTKAIPNDKIVSGPFYVLFNEIPLPVGFLFGMFPAQRKSASGIIFPSYGEERRRGFNFRGGGYFFDISDYVKLAVTGDIYSKGGHALYLNSNYTKRYAYNGSFNFSYSKTRTSDRVEDESVFNDFRLTWSHSPQSKGTGRFSASVNAATATFNQNNNMMYGTANELYANRMSNITAKLNSNVSYNKRFAGTPFSMGINLSHNQDLGTRLVDLPLPNLSLNMTNIYPFQREGLTGPLDNFSIGYTMAATNRISNNLGRLTPTAEQDSIAPFTIENLPLFFRNAKKGIRHSIPISYSFKALKFFTVSPSVNYEEKWYFEKLDYKYDFPSQEISIDTLRQFNRISNYSLSTSLTTRIYGIYIFKPQSKVKAIRHIINPNVSFSYQPDFSENPDYFQRLVDFNGVAISPGDTVFNDLGENNLLYRDGYYYKSRHDGFAYGGSTLGKSASINFGIGNNLEMKVRGEKDSVDRKVMLLNNLSISSGYNILADSFNLANFSVAANTSILNNLINMNVSASIDPYSYFVQYSAERRTDVERRINEFAWKAGKIGRITTATLALNTNLNPSMRGKEQETRKKVAEADIPEADKQHIIQNPNAYVDFEIPWSLNIGYSLNYSHRLNATPTVVQSLQASGDLSLSEKWKITYNTGYDFEMKELTQTNLGISRDIHCWQMNLTWVPFGRFQSYNFTIAVKASVLRDLKLERRRPFLDNL
ncbi:MAG TPA: putative LPS assembly protein LptD [Chryseosolibacter sp.]|nr:putative LPS assembly protein LptD [Chryseosolibacter sp.]